MAVAPGTRFGAYEVAALIGVGGMGEVYRARDTKLDRDVAIKILPPHFATDADRVLRFEREAKTLAALNHTNIAHIYGIDDAGGQPSLVMELIEGPTLAERLAEGALPCHEALLIARQITAALEAAHQHDIVHRDLKPGNIKLRPDGTVKVLDFGLAKAVEPAGVGASASYSPTITSPAMTQHGVILGTAAYMSPEQARGKTVDERADIWAFGVVLFEMLTGARLFAGDEVSDTLAFVLTREPDWNELPVSVPPAARRLLRRCLQRDRAQRLADIADARLELDEAVRELAAPPAAVSVARPQPVWIKVAPWAIAVAAAVALALVVWAPWTATPEPLRLMRVGVDFGAGAEVTTGLGITPALSPDGTTLAFVARRGTDISTPAQIYIRQLDQLEAVPIAGTDGAQTPFFSPDGQWIGFFAGGELKKVATGGGPVMALAGVVGARGGMWTATDDIVFASQGVISRIPAAGGSEPVALTVRSTSEFGHVTPYVLPGNRALLYVVPADLTQFNTASIMIKPLPDGEPRVLYRGGYHPQYIASGHLAWIRDGTVMVAPFDLERLALTGPPAAAVTGVTTNVTLGAAYFAVAGNGTLAYLPGIGTTVTPTPLMWLARSGELQTMRPNPVTWALPRFSPDGSRLAITVSDGRQQDIWIYEWQRDIYTRLTSDAAPDLAAVWSPDGRWIAFASTRDGTVGNLYLQRADGTGTVQRLTSTPEPQIPGSWHPSGRFIAFHEGNPASGRQRIMALPLDGGADADWKAGTPIELVGGPFLKAYPTFSPDGRWFAYAANDTGRFEVYVQPFPGPGTRIQISSAGATLGLWSQTRNELFFAQAQGGTMMVVPFSISGNELRPTRPQQWSPTRFEGVPPLGVYGPGYAIHPDGQRFVVSPAQRVATATARQLVLLINGFDELRRIAPTER